MSSNTSFRLSIQRLESLIIEDYEKGRVIDRLELFMQPDSHIIEELIEKLFRVVFPGYFRDYTYRVNSFTNA